MWRVGEAKKAAGTVKSLWKKGGFGNGCKEDALWRYSGSKQQCIEPKGWDLREAVGCVEMRCLRSKCGLTLWDRVGKEEVRRQAQILVYPEVD